MVDADNLAAALCDTLIDSDPKKRLEVAQRTTSYLMEFVAYDIARNHSCSDAAYIFHLVSEFESRVKPIFDDMNVERKVIKIH